MADKYILSPSENKEAINKLNLDKELSLKILNFSWGKAKNLIVNCVDLYTDVEFFFSVFNDDDYYSSKSGDFKFKEYKERTDRNDLIIAKFEKTSGGFLKCISAREVKE